MQRTMCKSKIHRAKVTATKLYYEGSIAIDRLLLERADILTGEQVQVLNVNSGQRFTTYAIPAPAGSGTILLNGPAARMGEPGDPVIILTYASLPDAEARAHQPIIVHVNAKNRAVKK